MTIRNKKQTIFREIVLGTLVYSVVLGFFNDYTDMLHTESYSTTFAVAVVLQALTYATFQLKYKVAGHFKAKTGRLSKPALVFSVWLIMFLSKFVFLGVVSFIFDDLVEISGFVGLLLIILTMTMSKLLVDYTYNKLAD